jgi:hypothetical protein
MQIITKRWVMAVVFGLAALTGCSKPDSNPATKDVKVDTTSQPAEAPPPGDSTPKAADSSTRSASEGSNEKTGGSGTGSQSTVGTAASGAPPYTVGGAPEGNQASGQGTKSGEPAKK